MTLMTIICLEFVFTFFLIIFPDSTSLAWESMTAFPGSPRHHPITFANETHAFLLTGSTNEQTASSDFYLYNSASDAWTDLSNTSSAFPGTPRSFGYGVVLNIPFHSKAYLGMGSGATALLNDLWEFDMVTHAWKELASLPGPSRRHPAMNAVRKTTQGNRADDTAEQWEIHVGVGDGSTGNLQDWWIYDIMTDAWEAAPDFPAVARHHPFYFTLGASSYAGMGHSSQGIERDWFRMENRTWIVKPNFESYNNSVLVTTEARVAGTQFAIEFDETPVGNNNELTGSFGFVLSGDGDDHSSMDEGEFHAFDGTTGQWHALAPHPGLSRWAPGSFVMRGTAVAYFTSGYERTSQALYNDLWRIDLSPLFLNSSAAPSPSIMLPPADMPLSSDEGTAPPSNAWMRALSVGVLSCCWIMMTVIGEIII